MPGSIILFHIIYCPDSIGLDTVINLMRKWKGDRFPNEGHFFPAEPHTLK